MSFLTQGPEGERVPYGVDKTNWKYILIVVILAVIVGGGILGYQWWVSKEEMEPPAPERKEEILEVLVSACENIPHEKEIEKTLCFINLGEEGKDINLCNQVKDIREKGYCYGGVAGAEKDLTVCLGFQHEIEIWYEKAKMNIHTPAELSWIYFRDIPLNLDSAEFSTLSINPPITGHGIELAWAMGIYFGSPCYIGAAVVQEEPEVCNWGFGSILPSGDFCSSRVTALLAAIKKDLKICDEALKNFEVGGGFAALCYGIVGSETKNPDLCNKINDDKIKASCFSYIARVLKDPEICKKVSPEPFPLWKDYCYFEAARTRPELGTCNGIKSYPQVLDDCYVLLAGILYDENICERRAELLVKKDTKCEEHLQSKLKLVKDLSICEKLKKAENKENCYLYTAVNLKNIEICEKIKNSQARENCYSELARILGDEMMCEKIQNSEAKSKCYSDFIGFHTYELKFSYENVQKFSKTRAINICENIQNEREKEICWHAMAEFLKDFSFCNKIKNQEQLPNKNWCYFNLIITGKVELKDSTVCQEITKYQDDCYRSVAKALGDVDICDNLEGKDRGYCQAAVAKTLTDKSICERIEFQGPKESCYVSLAGHLGDEMLCLKIKERNEKDKCYLAVAKVKKDRNLCEKIYSPGGCWIPNHKHDCYSALAFDLKESNLCEKIECKRVRDRCFNLLATRQTNLNLCEKIETKSEQEECKSYINIRIKLEEKGWKLGD